LKVQCEATKLSEQRRKQIQAAE